jgi:hypothetical protein
MDRLLAQAQAIHRRPRPHQPIIRLATVSQPATTSPVTPDMNQATPAINLQGPNPTKRRLRPVTLEQRRGAIRTIDRAVRAIIGLPWGRARRLPVARLRIAMQHRQVACDRLHTMPVQRLQQLPIHRLPATAIARRLCRGISNAEQIVRAAICNIQHNRLIALPDAVITALLS